MKIEKRYILKLKHVDMFLAERGLTSVYKYARRFEDYKTAQAYKDFYQEKKIIELEIIEAEYDLLTKRFTLITDINSNNKTTSERLL